MSKSYNEVTLYKADTSTGKICIWQGWIEIYNKKTSQQVKIKASSLEDPNLDKLFYAIIQMKNGYEGMKLRSSVRKVEEGKNIGKKNATNIYTQAVSELRSRVEKKIKKEGYMRVKEEAVGKAKGDEAAKKKYKLYAPMLAEVYKEHMDKVKSWSKIYIQRKFDGTRCLSFLGDDDEVVMYSRGNEMIQNYPEVRRDLMHFFKSLGKNSHDLYLDGELYAHGIPRQRFSGISRKKPENLSKDDIEMMNKVKYTIFDCILINSLDATFEDRFVNGILPKLLKDGYDTFSPVETTLIKDIAKIDELFKKYKSEGYEGAILRNGDSAYKTGKGRNRTSDLLKVKSFDDAEFKVIGYELQKGNNEGAVVWKVKNNLNDKEFKVTPSGTIEERRELAREAKKYIGKYLVVRFLGRSAEPDLIPQVPITDNEIRPEKEFK